MAAIFGATSTTDEVLAGVDLSGKRILVTGVSAGLGVETARALAAHGAQVVGAARDLDKAEARDRRRSAPTPANGGGAGAGRARPRLARQRARLRRRAWSPPASRSTWSSPTPASWPRPFGKTADGFETQFGTNHLGHFVLVNRIASLLKPGARLVNLSSAGHRFSDVDLDDPNFEHTPYTEFGAYGRSKTANILFAVEFDRRHKARGVRATAVHPGGIQTELGRHMTPEVIAADDRPASTPPAGGRRAGLRAGRPSRRARRPRSGPASSRRPTRSAAATARTATWPRSSKASPTVRGGVRAYALDPERAKALWAKSEEMVGERF